MRLTIGLNNVLNIHCSIKDNNVPLSRITIAKICAININFLSFLLSYCRKIEMVTYSIKENVFGVSATCNKCS